MVLANPPLAEPVTDPGGVINKPPFEMGVANFANFGEALRIVQDRLHEKNFYAFNPGFDCCEGNVK